jgi:uncharacterized membrane protein
MLRIKGRRLINGRKNCGEQIKMERCQFEDRFTIHPVQECDANVHALHAYFNYLNPFFFKKNENVAKMTTVKNATK